MSCIQDYGFGHGFNVYAHGTLGTFAFAHCENRETTDRVVEYMAKERAEYAYSIVPVVVDIGSFGARTSTHRGWGANGTEAHLMAERALKRLTG